eukprot:m.1515210 g.1515210  ORF g.1515210 m.1515210 type:complete len:87 (+) comp25216_c0_seq3:3534-3794(+)
MTTATGCAVHALLQTASCVSAPHSVCIYECNTDTYWDANYSACLPLSQCNAVFRKAVNTSQQFNYLQLSSGSVSSCLLCGIVCMRT